MSQKETKWPGAAVAMRPIREIMPYASNPRMHSPEQVNRIKASMLEFGFTNALLLSEGGEVIAGHGRLLAAMELGFAEVPVMVAEGWTHAQVQAYRIADNQLTLLGEWDDDLLAAELHALNADGFDLDLTGFDGAELDRLLAPLDEDAADGEDDSSLDDAPEVPRIPISRPGDLWMIGGHRLLCGDSTDADHVARLMDGDRATLLFTSPPYGNQREYTTGGISDWDALMRGVFGQIDDAMEKSGQVLVNLGLVHRDGEWVPYWDAWIEWMRASGWRRFGLYVWDQGPGVPTGDLARLSPSFELVFHFNRESRAPNKIIPCKSAGQVIHHHGEGGIRQKDGSINTWTGGATQPFRRPDSVIRVQRQCGAVGDGISHPAPFPVALPEFVMDAYSDGGDIVYEPFSGSGSTIIAGERKARRVRAMELAPEYVDVAVLRWQQRFPDQPAMLDGRPFSEVAAERGVGAENIDAA